MSNSTTTKQTTAVVEHISNKIEEKNENKIKIKYFFFYGRKGVGKSKKLK